MLFIIFAFLTSTITYHAPTVYAHTVPLPVSSSTLTFEEKASYIAHLALKEGVDSQEALSIAIKESNLNPQAVGDKGTSYGTWQIHLSAHPEITKAQAEDFYWSTRWAINELKKGKCFEWSTCGRFIDS